MEGGQDQRKARNIGARAVSIMFGGMRTVSDHSLCCTIHRVTHERYTELCQSQNIDDIDPRYIYHVCCGKHKR